MLHDSVAVLIVGEQVRQDGRFLEDVDLDQYLAKLDQHAEILTDVASGRCRGVVAFYCNDRVTRRAYITLVLVDPQDRGLGIGKSLVGCALSLARRRGFTSCRLEVAGDNETAQAMYRAMGFRPIERSSGKDLLEIQL